jgi:3-hydroxyacyl-[acyl-carrier-protein] dehydratase
VEAGVHAVAQAAVSSGPGFPQALLVECIAQLAGILTIQEEGEGGFLAAIDRADFSGTPLTGDQLSVSVRVVKSFGRLFMVEGEVACDGRTLATARLTLGVGRL